MAIERLSTRFYARNDIMDTITPLVFVQPEIRAPHGEFKPAAWLPIVWTQSNKEAGTDAFVCSMGKAVAMDSQGRIVPAGLRTSLGGNGSTSVFAGTVLTYTQTDVDWGVTNLTTGQRLVAPVSYTGEQLCDALIERGLVDEIEAVAAGATVPVAADADVNIVIDLFISRPIGVAAQDYFVWSGRPEDGDQFYHNYSKQHLVSFFTEMQMRVPQRVAAATTTDGFNFFTLDSGGPTVHVPGSFINVGEYWDAAGFVQLNRYSAVSATAPVVALGLAYRPVAKNTSRTPVTCDRAGVLVRERAGIERIAKEGDWYLDAEMGVLFLHEDTWATVVSLGSATTNFGYSYYTNAGVASGERFALFDGPCKPGDFIVVDSQSNFTVASATQVAAYGEIVGRVTRKVAEPLNLLEHVKTPWKNVSGLSGYSKVTGTATDGYSTLITYASEAGERVADQLVEFIFRAP